MQRNFAALNHISSVSQNDYIKIYFSIIVEKIRTYAETKFSQTGIRTNR
jgi:hypothetical protein